MRLRFAPSPTGNLHIGSVRTALFNWVYARSLSGTLVLRIEDTDLARSKPEFETNILEGLEWLGLDMDEGPHSNGDYRQSERIQNGVYQRYVEQLIAEKKAYYCFETEAELDAEREAAKERGEAYVYSGKSLQLSETEVQQRLNDKQAYTIRFHINAAQDIVVPDLIRGDITFDTGLLSDFIIMKSDGSPAYNFAVVVDDIDMAITHVIRGEDHISNTPRQILLYRALGKAEPYFAHLPIILGTDKSKLSKRHGASAVTDYRDLGYLPDAIVNYLSLLGWSPPDGNELLSRKELVSCFDISRVSKSGAVFDETKLRWMNGQYIRALSETALWEQVAPFVSPDMMSRLSQYDSALLPKMAASIQDNLELLSDITTYLNVYGMTMAEFEQAVAEQTFIEQATQVLTLFKAHIQPLSTLSPQDVESGLETVLEETGFGKGKVLKPVRLATTGLGSGPHLPDCLSLLGLETVSKRIDHVLASL